MSATSGWMNSDRPTPRNLKTRDTTNICSRKPDQVDGAEQAAVGGADELLARRGVSRDSASRAASTT